MLVPLLLISAGLPLLFGGAEILVRAASQLASRLGVSQLVVGLTVVAFGTSAPELVVGIQAALAGEGAIAVGNAVGSNIANVGLILAVAVLIRPVRVDPRLLRTDIPLVIGASVLVAALLVDRGLNRPEGALLVGALVAYLALTVVFSQRPAAPPPTEDPAAPIRGSAVRDLVIAFGGLALLVIGAESLVRGGSALAAAVGVPAEIVGLTLIAVGTSLPELITSAVAAMRGKGDLAVGNVVGSNLFNLTGVLGIAAVVRPIEAPALAFGDIGAMVAAAVLLLPLAVSQRTLTRPEGTFLLAAYAAYALFVFMR